MQKFFLVLLALFQLTAAYWDVGHSIVVEIARRTVSPNMSEAMEILNNIDLAYFPEEPIPFAGTWPDVVKTSTHLFDNWHYIDIPYIEPPMTAETLGITIDFDMHNITATLNEIISHTFRSENISAWVKAFSLRFLFHLLGDLHQPLHCVSLYNSRFNTPIGDMGGNLFYINYTSETGTKIPNLHAFFDSVGGLYTQTRPDSTATDAERQEFDSWFHQQVTGIMEENPLSSTPVLEEKINVTAWAWESYQNSIDYAYSRLTYKQTLTPEYVAEIRKLLRRELALGGYRLANIISQANLAVYGPLPTPVAPSSSSNNKGTVVALAVVLGCSWLLFAFVYMRLRSKRQDTSIQENSYQAV